MAYPPRHQRNNESQPSGLSFRNFSRVAHPHFTRVTAKRPTIKEIQPRGLSLLLLNYSQVAYHVLGVMPNSFERASQEFQPHGLSLLLMTYSHVAYHFHWRRAKQLQTSITWISAAWLTLTTHELQPSGLSCSTASCQTAPSSNTGISAVWPILTAHNYSHTAYHV